MPELMGVRIMKNSLLNKKAQITIYIIVAIVLVALVVGFVIIRNLTSKGLPASIEPVYETFLSCLEEDVLTGVSVLESQGGYIYIPDFEPGSDYMPFSSQLDFLGNPIPYWYYVSGNNIEREKIPSKDDMEKELKTFIESETSNCVFENYYDEGFVIQQGTPEADVQINDGTVSVSLKMPLTITKEEDNAKINTHKIEITSQLGSLYKSAREVYNYEQKNLFLETYGLDTLRLYAPVDGVEVSCSPLKWDAEEIFSELEDAIEANTLALKTKDNDYSLDNKEDEYFVVDISTGKNIRFINSKTWPHTFEVNPSQGNLLLSLPVGNQPGLGILGFCYVPYHFVYDIKYPVLVQVSESSGENQEIFQFPMAVIIQGNKERKPVEGSNAVDVGLPELCTYPNTLVNVKVINTNLAPVDAEISFECFGTKCTMGETENGILNAQFPQCANGYVLADAEGYYTGKEILTTIESGNVEIILDKKYEMQIDLALNNVDYNGQAIITFASDKISQTVIYPEQQNISLIEGQYNITVQIYRESQLRLNAVTKQECVDVPTPGIIGIFGFTQDKCFEVNIPEQTVSNVLTGGGEQAYYIAESELQDSSTIRINSPNLPTPNTIEQLQENYILFEQNNLGISFY